MLEFTKTAPSDEKLWEAIWYNPGIHVEEGYTLQQVRLSILLILKRDFDDLSVVNERVENGTVNGLLTSVTIPKVLDMPNFDTVEELIHAYAISLHVGTTFLSEVLDFDLVIHGVERDNTSPLSSSVGIKLFGLPHNCFPFKPASNGEEFTVMNKQDMVDDMYDRLHAQFETPTTVQDLRGLTTELPKYVLKESARPDVKNGSTTESAKLSWDDIEVGTVLKCISDKNRRTVGNLYSVTRIEGEKISVTDNFGASYESKLDFRKEEFTIISHPAKPRVHYETSIGTIRVGSKVEYLGNLNSSVWKVGEIYEIESVDDANIKVSPGETYTCSRETAHRYFKLKEF